MTNEMILSNNLRGEMLDLDLLEVVNEALHSLDSVRETGLALQVNVLDEVVTVSGVVLSRIMRQVVLQTVSRVPGVRNVISRLYTDTDLAAAVSQALAADPLTQAMSHIKVTSYRGQVMLVGKATGTGGAHAASQVASGVPGVRAVVNRLTLSETMH